MKGENELSGGAHMEGMERRERNGVDREQKHEEGVVNQTYLTFLEIYSRIWCQSA